MCSCQPLKQTEKERRAAFAKAKVASKPRCFGLTQEVQAVSDQLLSDIRAPRQLGFPVTQPNCPGCLCESPSARTADDDTPVAIRLLSGPQSRTLTSWMLRPQPHHFESLVFATTGLHLAHFAKSVVSDEMWHGGPLALGKNPLLREAVGPSSPLSAQTVSRYGFLQLLLFQCLARKHCQAHIGLHVRKSNRSETFSALKGFVWHVLTPLPISCIVPFPLL